MTSPFRPSTEEELEALLTDAFRALPGPDPRRLSALEDGLARRAAGRDRWQRVPWWWVAALLAAGTASAWWLAAGPGRERQGPEAPVQTEEARGADEGSEAPSSSSGGGGDVPSGGPLGDSPVIYRREAP